jgi:SNF2 family DNA or RNA helicase
MEERIDERIDGKKQVAEQVVGSGEEWFTVLSAKELERLLKLDD